MIAATSDAITGRPSGLLRVCVVTTVAHGLGGMQRTTHDLVRGLVEAGHSVDVICPAHPSLDPFAHGATWHLLPTSGFLEERAQQLLRQTYLNADAGRRFDVIHSESGAALALLSNPPVETPVVVRYHGTYTSLARAHVRRSFTRPRTAAGEIKTLLKMTRVHFLSGTAWRFRHCVSVAVSRDQVAPTSHSSFVPRSLIHVVPNGIDPQLFRPRDRRSLRRAYGLPDGQLLAVAGRIDREKGFDVAVRMLASVARDYPDVHLLVIGDGDREPSLRALAERLGISGRTLFVGPQSPERVAEFLAASDVFLFPTLRHEAGPIVLLEGMSCGLPTIATPLGGIKEVIAPTSEAPAGILVPPDDVDALAAGVRTLLDDAALARELGRQARERILAEYTLDRMLDGMVAVYRIAIARTVATASI